MEKRKAKLQERRAKRRKRNDCDEDDTHEIPETPGMSACNETNDSAKANGIIESVFLKDFMCHSRLEFKFGQNVNFIIGRNGSGKSAILTAVVVALGGKANVTSRGSSLKSFIRSGKREAVVAVKLRNVGNDGYRVEEYGSQIIVERRLTAEGNTSYKLMSKDRKVVSTKREDLLRILDFYNIQVDNPMSVLNQEVSRNFLNSKSPKDKYTFFLKATQLEQLNNDYSLAKQQKRQAETLLSTKKESLPVMEQEVKSLERKRDFLDTLEHQKEKLTKLKHELIWLHVKVGENELGHKQEELDKEKSYLEAYQKKISECQAAVERKIAERDEVQKQVELMVQKINDVQPQRKATKVELDALRTELKNKQLEMRRLINAADTCKKDEEELTKRIEELRVAVQQDYTKEKQERLNTIEQLEQQKQSMLAQKHSSMVHRDQLKSSSAHFKEEMSSLVQEQREKQQNKDFLESQIKNLVDSKTNQMKRFGSYVPALWKAIEVAYHQKRFKQKPRGPLGACLKLRDPKWALAVESCIRSLLTAFCCDNYSDERVLQQLMGTILGNERKPSIIVSAFSSHRYDVSRYAVHSPPHPSVLDMLEISDPVVANCLIDQRGIESILLVANNKDARQLMLRNVPRNCRETFMMSGDHIYAAPNFRYYSSTKRNPEFLHKDVEEQIRQKRAELRELEEQLLAINKKISGSKSEERNIAQELQTTEMTLAKVSQAIQNVSLKISQLQSIEDPEPLDVSVLEEELNSLARKRQELAEQHRQHKQTFEEGKSKMVEKEREHKELENILQRLFGELEPLKESLSNAETRIQDQRERKKRHETQCNARIRKFKEEERKHQENVASLNDKKRKAEQVCPRIESRRSIPNLESEVVQLEDHLKNEKLSQGNREDILAKYVELRSTYEQNMKEVRMLEEFLKLLTKSLDQRARAYIMFRQQLSLRIKVLFIAALSQRHFLGKLTFDHEKESLDIMIRPDENSNGYLHDTRSLSGGERSFATVSLVLALWDATESPFRILDEFDVFMDMVTRRISMDMMLSTALQKNNTQFVFLTPLEMSSLPSSNKIRVCRMPDPDRTQGVLPFASPDEAGDQEDM